MEYGRSLKRVLAKPVEKNPMETQMQDMINELFNARTSFHKIHLKITGPGSDAAHRALGGFYDEIVGLADDLAEQYQGATEKLLDLPDMPVVPVNSKEEALNLLRELYNCANETQASCGHSEIINTLDEVKSLINKTKYKLLFLQ